MHLLKAYRFSENRKVTRETENYLKSLCERDLIIIDECHGVKNSESNGAINLLNSIGPPGKGNPKRLLMTATPYSKDFTDLNNLLKFVHPHSQTERLLMLQVYWCRYTTHPLIANQFAKKLMEEKQ